MSRERWGRVLRSWKGTVWLGGTLALVAAVVGLLLVTGGGSSRIMIPQPRGDDVTFGARGAKVVLVEYADFQCPACASYAPMLTSLRSRYGDRVLFVFRFFPLKIHDYAIISAQAAYAAFLQGKFWQMHDILYAHQREWEVTTDPSKYFYSYAQRLGIDIGRFRTDMQLLSTKDYITHQKEGGLAIGINHTPEFFLNGVSISPDTEAQFSGLIDRQLALASQK